MTFNMKNLYPKWVIRSDGEKEHFKESSIAKVLNKETGLDMKIAWEIAEEIVRELILSEKETVTTKYIREMACLKLTERNLDRHRNLFSRDFQSKYIKFRLNEEFLNEYKRENPNLTELGKFIYKRTYSRVINETEKEEFWQTLQRVVEGVYSIQKEHCKRLGLPWSDDKAQRSAQIMFKKIWNFKFTPPGRGFWMMGTDFVARRGSASLNNCAFVSTKDINIQGSQPFQFLMDMLMLGVGVGFDVRGAETVTIKKPEFKGTFQVPDSREGWVEGLGLILDGYFFGNKIPEVMDYSLIRPAGSPIRGFGGTASGPDPLDKLYQDVMKLLNKRIGEKITSLDIMDIMNMIAKCVIAGNVRRSAEIALGKYNDTDFILAKQDKEKLESHRWASNNSIIAKQGMDYEFVAEQITKNGEPGVFWIENARKWGRTGEVRPDEKVMGVNPCLIGSTTIATADGRNGVTIEQLYKEGEKVPVYSAKRINYANQFGESDTFSHYKDEIKLAKPIYKGKKRVINIHLSDGSFFSCTPDHLLALDNGEWIEAKKSLGKKLSKFYSFSNRNTGKNYRHINTKSNGYKRQYRMIWEFYNGEYNGKKRTLHHIDGNPLNDSIDNLELLSKSEHTRMANNKKIGKNNPVYKMNQEYFRWLNKKKNIKANATRYNWSYERYENELNKFLMNNPKPEVKDKSICLNEEIYVREIEDRYMTKDVYDLQVEDNHNFYIITKTIDENYLNSSGVLIHNCGEQSLESYELCCLAETFPSRHESYEEFEETLKYAYLYAKSVTLVNTHWKETNAVMLKNRRIGISQTGIVEAFEKHGRAEMLKWCDKGYTYLRNLDDIYSKWLCVPKSVKITTVKPSGTVSLLAGVSAGIHYPHSEYYIRRVRVSAESPLLEEVEDMHVEDDVYSPNTKVVEFPIHKKYFGKSKSEVSMWEQAANAADYQKYWSDNQVSITITFKPEEEEDIVSLLECFEDKLKAVTLLPLDDGVYKQAPYEKLTQQEYENLCKKN